MKLAEFKQLSIFEEAAIKNSYKDLCLRIANKESLIPDEFGESLKNWSSIHLKQPINIVALFSGAGGLDIGFCDAGFKLIQSVELEEKFVTTMQYNQAHGRYFPGAEITCGDIRKYHPTINQKIDFVIGGPPCQSFSAAGRRAAGVAGTKDDRGNLFEEYVRILQILKPKGFLFENVYGLIGAEKGEAIKKITSAFRSIGYNISYRILDAADYGVPQHRERLIIVGSKGKLFKFPKPTHGPDSAPGNPHYTAYEAILNIDHSEPEKLPIINGRFGHLLKDIPHGLNYSFFTERMGHPNPIFSWRSKFSDFLYKADPMKPVRTLKASGGQYTGPFHWNNRHFTAEELKRLQTFPNDYKILGNRAIVSKQIGNSVPPQFARLLALSVLDQFFDVELPFSLYYLEEVDKLTFRRLKTEKTGYYSQRAANALRNSSEQAPNKIKTKAFSVELTNNFKLRINSKSDIKVRFKPTSKRWVFELSRKNSDQGLYNVSLRRKDASPLFLDISEVQLISSSSVLTDYTILWKTFEEMLSTNSIKADLVQLNGYYQYSNNIEYCFNKISDELNNNLWKILELILIDPSIGQIRNIESLSESYEIPQMEFINCLYELKKIGFEIRNSNTNPEIPHNHYLIPYKFPTLTPLSVQLKKSL